MTGAAHGAICGALLPHVLRMNGRMAPGPRMRAVEDWLRTAFGVDDGPTALEHWMHAAGLPRLTALGVGADSFDPIVAAAMQASSTRGNPFPPEAHHLRAVLAAACLPLTPPEPA